MFLYLLLYIKFHYICEFICDTMFYSIIIPVYNRPQEVDELLLSLTQQLVSTATFEVVIVEDGSSLPCTEVIQRYAPRLNIHYHCKPNSGQSDSRNVGMTLAKGDYFLFFDSDCVIPPQYFATLENNLHQNYADCFGGPDAAHESFTPVQKAINYAMTSFFTTGGIRGGKKQMEKFKPRTFNMGFSRKVYETIGGFGKSVGPYIVSEDIDIALRIDDAGFRTALYHDNFVYHKRRGSFGKFYKQVSRFGTGRVKLSVSRKGSLKLVHALPALMLLGGAALLTCFLLAFYLLPICSSLAFYLQLACLSLPTAYCLLLFGDALRKTKNLKVAVLAVWASIIQIVGYGWGFITAMVQVKLMNTYK